MAIPLIGAGLAVDVQVFSPGLLPGLQLWLDANDSATLFQDSAGSTPALSDGDPIGRWADKSGNARHATQSDGTKKLALRTALQNGLNVSQFDGVNDYLDFTPFAIQYGHAWIAYSTPDLGGDKALLARSVGPGLYSSLNGFYSSAGTFYGNKRPSIYYYMAGASQDQSVQVNETVILAKAVRFSWLSNSMSVRVNEGTPASSSLAASPLGNWLTVGGNPHFFHGEICEIAITTTAPTQENIDNMNTYLMNKWGIL